jgi:hypothetical protein
MAEVQIERAVQAPATNVWEVLRDFGDISWIPPAGHVDVEGEGPGMRRLIHGSGDGPPVSERLVSVDEDTQTIVYVIDENNPLPTSGYRGTVTISGEGDTSAIRWVASFEPAGDADEASAVVELMLTALSQWLAEAAEAR